MKALEDLLIHEALGPRARFERYAADMLFEIAAGIKIDAKRSERFSKQIEKIYRNPFVIVQKQPETKDEIVDYIYRKVEEVRHGLNDAGCENPA